MIYDVTNKKSFENLRDKWIKGFDEYAANAMKVLIGNKSDLAEM